MSDPTFLVTKGTTAQEALFDRALRRSDFPWTLLADGLVERGLTVIRVRFQAPPFGPGFSGQYRGGSSCTLYVNPDYSARNQQRTILHELGHAVDDLWMTQHRRKLVHKLFHVQPWTDPWTGPTSDVASELAYAREGFASGMEAFMPDPLDLSLADFTHVLRRDDFDAFRGIVLLPKPTTEPPDPEPIPDPDPPPPDPIIAILQAEVARLTPLAAYGEQVRAIPAPKVEVVP